ncbi:MAG: hypothetical protein Q9200_007725 [Gallowayella weberi]
MYDDASFYTFIPPTAAPQDERQTTPKHKRRQSLLKQPNEDSQANDRTLDAIGEVSAAPTHDEGPPKPSLTRRAQSYTDFHHAAKAVLSRNASHKKHKELKSYRDIKDDLEFADWYGDLENDLLDASHEEYTTLDLLTSLSDSFRSVEAQTTIFQKQCEGLTLEQKRLTQLTDGITQNLKYYSFLEPVTRRLNAPGAGNLVRSEEFSKLLGRLDECLEYMAAHVCLNVPDSRDSD